MYVLAHTHAHTHMLTHRHTHTHTHTHMHTHTHTHTSSYSRASMAICGPTHMARVNAGAVQYLNVGVVTERWTHSSFVVNHNYSTPSSGTCHHKLGDSKAYEHMCCVTIPYSESRSSKVITHNDDTCMQSGGLCKTMRLHIY